MAGPSLFSGGREDDCKTLSHIDRSPWHLGGGRGLSCKGRRETLWSTVPMCFEVEWRGYGKVARLTTGGRYGYGCAELRQSHDPDEEDGVTDE